MTWRAHGMWLFPGGIYREPPFPWYDVIGYGLWLAAIAGFLWLPLVVLPIATALAGGLLSWVVLRAWVRGVIDVPRWRARVEFTLVQRAGQLPTVESDAITIVREGMPDTTFSKLDGAKVSPTTGKREYLS